MRLPHLNAPNNKSKQYIIDFKGINTEPVAQEGEMTEMRNLCSSFSPCLSPREKREVIKTLTTPTDIGSVGDKLYYIDNGNFYYNDILKGSVAIGRKSIAIMNDFVIIFPDKVAYDTINDKWNTLDNTNSKTGLVFSDVAITTTNAFTGFKVGDAVTISGCAVNTTNNRSAIIKAITDTVMTFYSNTFTVGTETASVTIKREVPDLLFIIEADNRLWGCNDKNEIFGSKIGSHNNFNVFDGLVTDSYTCNVGTAGPFTGAINYNNNILFFKDDFIHRIYGFKPANFQVITTNTQGVKSGCERSLAIANNMLFYVSRVGVVVYNGSVPDAISEKLGNGKITDCTAGSDKLKIYFSIQINDKWYMYVYDTIRNVWHMEDNTHALRFDYFSGDLIYLDADKKEIVKVNGNSTENIQWSAITGEMNEYYMDKKGSSKLKMRIELEANSYVGIYINSDNKGWVLVKTIQGLSKKSILMPIKPQRCDYFKIKIEGRGECRIYSIVREFYVGSDI